MNSINNFQSVTTYKAATPLHLTYLPNNDFIVELI